MRFCKIGAFINRIGFGAHNTIIVISYPHNIIIQAPTVWCLWTEIPKNRSGKIQIQTHRSKTRTLSPDGYEAVILQGTGPGSYLGLPIGPIVVPFWGSYEESCKVIPKRSYTLGPA